MSLLARRKKARNLETAVYSLFNAFGILNEVSAINEKFSSHVSPRRFIVWHPDKRSCSFRERAERLHDMTLNESLPTMVNVPNGVTEGEKEKKCKEFRTSSDSLYISVVDYGNA